jgi:hypothetical protein
VHTCVDRAAVEVGRLVPARHAKVRGDDRSELIASGGGAVAGVVVVPGCGQRGLRWFGSSRRRISWAILSGVLRSSTVILWSRLRSCGRGCAGSRGDR